MQEYYPEILTILEKNNFTVVLLFSNYEIRKIDFKEFLTKFPKDKNSKLILLEKHWQTLRLDNGTLFFPNIMKQYGGNHIDNFSIYDFSIKADFKTEYIRQIRKIKKLTQKQLANKIKVKQPEISALETGKKTNLKLLQKALSVLL